MNLHQTLGLCLSTNDPQSIRTIMLPSLSNLVQLSEVSTFLINFQPPYTQSDVLEVVNTIESYGFEVKYTYTEYPKELFEVNVPMARIRNDAAKLLKEAKIYALIDDDMSFGDRSRVFNKTSGEQYLDIVRYMMDFDRCGVVLVGGSLFRAVPTHHIGPVSIDNTFLCYKGMFLRNCIKDCLIDPVDAESLVGCDEEKIACAARIYEGYFVAKMRGGRTNHVENYKRKAPGYKKYEWNKFELVEANATKYIREHYNPDFGGNKSSIGGPNYYNVVDLDHYLSKGGIDWRDDDIRSRFTLDFTNTTPSHNIKAIKNILECEGEIDE